MLVEFRVANFRSFHEEQVLSLVASKDKTLPDNLIPCEKFSLLKAAAVYGPNASGKSNLVKALNVMHDFVRNSATSMSLGDAIPGIVPFRLASAAVARPSSFQVTVLVDGTPFEYGFAATSGRVHEEWLIAYPPPHRRAQRWFERRIDPDTGDTLWAFRWQLERHGAMLRERTRDNGLVLSRGAELNVPGLAEFFLWFRNRLWVFDLSDRPRWLVQATARFIKNNQELRQRVIQLLRHADLGIEDIGLVEEELKLDDIPTEAREALPQTRMRELGRKPMSFMTIRALHHVDGQEQRAVFDFEEAESNGTQRLFALAGPVLDALARGAVIVVDEIDCSMHPLLTRKLIELFQSPSANRAGAQLIFATHDSTLMDPGLLRRDQIWLTEKNQRGATELFSLYDFDARKRPRHTEAFQRRYLAGRYGAVPKFGPTFEDSEL